jgi:hypothetical protein
LDRSITGRRNDVQIHQQNFVKFHFYFCRTIGSKTVRLSDCRHTEPSDFWGVILYEFLMYVMRASYGSLSKYTYFSVITQLKDKYQPNWLEKTCFARRHISFSWFYHLIPDWFNCEFILATQRPVFFLGITCYFSRITYFWSIVLFRCNDFIQSFYYCWTILKALITNNTTLFFLGIYWNLTRKLA